MKIWWTASTLWRARREPGLAYRPLDEILAIQARRIQAIARHAYATVPFYREAMRRIGMEPGDVRSARDLAALPTVGRDELARAPGRFASTAMAEADGLDIRSSGTSGQARTIRWDAQGLFDSLVAERRQRAVLARFIGGEVGFRDAVIARAGGVRPQLQRFYAERLLPLPGIRPVRIELSAALPFADLLARLNAFRPDVIRGYGSQLGGLLRWIHEGGRPFAPPRAIVYGADAMPDADRRLIEQEMGVPVLSNYQAVEALRLAFQCEARRGFHLHLDHVAVRVVEASGREVGEGEAGELVVSTLTNRATVLLNYRLGDVVTRGPERCECGRTLPTLARIEGRADDAVRRPDGTPLHALAVITPLQAVAGVRQVQVVQEAVDAFLVRVVPGPPHPGVEASVAQALRDALGGGIAVRVERVDRIAPEAGGKVRAVISRVPA